MTKETVYLGYDNECSIVVTDDNGPIDFSTFTKIVINLYKLPSKSIVSTIDTDIAPDLINFSSSEGVLIFKFGGLLIPSGEYGADLIAYDVLRPNGLKLADGHVGSLLCFLFED